MGLDSLVQKIETRNKETDDATYLKNILNEAVVRRNNDNLRKPSKYYSPSGLGGCRRKLYYKRIEAPIDDKQDIIAKNILKGESGTDRHERIQSLMVYMDENYDYDYEWMDIPQFIENRGLDYLEVQGIDDTGYEALLLDKRYNLRFRVDGLIKLRSRYYLLEIKTDDTFRWQKRLSVSDYHDMQGICYSLSLGLNKVMYVYEERNEFKKKPIIKEIKESDRKQVIKKIKEVDDYVNRKELPKKDVDKCMFCLYTNICKKDINPVGDKN